MAGLFPRTSGAGAAFFRLCPRKSARAAAGFQRPRTAPRHWPAPADFCPALAAEHGCSSFVCPHLKQSIFLRLAAGGTPACWKFCRARPHDMGSSLRQKHAAVTSSLSDPALPAPRIAAPQFAHTGIRQPPEIYRLRILSLMSISFPYTAGKRNTFLKTVRMILLKNPLHDSITGYDDGSVNHCPHLYQHMMPSGYGPPFSGHVHGRISLHPE
jgi:hypothetical protein